MLAGSQNSCSREIYFLAEKGKLAKDFDTKSQLKRAALSTMNNIAEGFGKYSSKEFIRYLDIARSHLKNRVVIADFDPRSQGRPSKTGFRLRGRNDRLLIWIFEMGFNNSASEVKNILYVLLDLEYFPEDEMTRLQAKSDDVKALSLALIKYLVNRRKAT